MKNIMSMMKQAQELQTKMAEFQAGLEALETEGVSGGGLVKVTLNGKGAMARMSVDESLMKPGRSRDPGGSNRRCPQRRQAEG